MDGPTTRLRGTLRRAGVSAIAVVLLCSLAVGARADTKQELDKAKRQLNDLVEFIGRIAANDAQLAAEMQNQANALAQRRQNIEDLLAQQRDQILELDNQRKVLDAKFNAQQQLVDQQQAVVDSLNADQAKA